MKHARCHQCFPDLTEVGSTYFAMCGKEVTVREGKLTLTRSDQPLLDGCPDCTAALADHGRLYH